MELFLFAVGILFVGLVVVFWWMVNRINRQHELGFRVSTDASRHKLEIGITRGYDKSLFNAGRHAEALSFLNIKFCVESDE